jgi:hypothetical protein
MLERGEMKRDVPSGDDTEEDDDEEIPCSVSPPSEQPFTPPTNNEDTDEVDPIDTNIKVENEFVDISYLEELDENDIPEFDLDVSIIPSYIKAKLCSHFHHVYAFNLYNEAFQ